MKDIKLCVGNKSNFNYYAELLYNKDSDSCIILKGSRLFTGSKSSNKDRTIMTHKKLIEQRIMSEDGTMLENSYVMSISESTNAIAGRTCTPYENIVVPGYKISKREEFELAVEIEYHLQDMDTDSVKKDCVERKLEFRYEDFDISIDEQNNHIRIDKRPNNSVSKDILSFEETCTQVMLAKYLADLQENNEVEVMDNTEENVTDDNLVVHTQYLGKDEYETVIPPLKINEDSMQKQADLIGETVEKVIAPLLDSLEIDKDCESKEYIRHYKVEKHLELKEFISNSVYNEDKLKVILSTIAKNRMTVLAGPSGMGKSYCIKDIAALYANSYIIRIKFSKTFTQHDFIQLETIEGTKVVKKDGVFIEAVKLAEEHPDSTVLIVIDELNHTDCEEVFGPVWELVNNGDDIKIAVANEVKTIPNNLKLIGTMNDVDVAIATKTLASIRRFNPVHVNFEDINTDNLPQGEMLNTLIDLNKEIAKTSKELEIGFSILFENKNNNAIDRINFRRKCLEHLEFIKPFLDELDNGDKVYENCCKILSEKEFKIDDTSVLSELKAYFH